MKDPVQVSYKILIGSRSNGGSGSHFACVFHIINQSSFSRRSTAVLHAAEYWVPQVNHTDVSYTEKHSLKKHSRTLV